MVRAHAVTLAAIGLALGGAVASAQGRQAAAPPVVRPFEALMPAVAATAPGTYIVDGTMLTKAPDVARIPVMLQADVLRGADTQQRVGIVVGADAPQAVDVRLRVWTVATGGQGPRVMADAGGSGSAGQTRLVREFSLPAGEYDLEAAVGNTAGNGTHAVAIAKSRLAVPDVRGGALVLTPVVVGDAETAPRRADVPFLFGGTALTPAVKAQFGQDGAISVAFRIYNWTAKAEEKPDLTVEYLFYEKGTKGLHFFNKVKPQELNGQTLGEAFNPAMGSVAAGMKIPLSAFTFGEFQLTVRVTDNRSRQTAERQLSFAVTP